MFDKDDKAVEESTDQPLEESLEDQPEADETSEEEELLDDSDQPDEESEEYVEIDGEQVSLSELKSGYLRQKDYTQKTQGLSEQRRELEAMKEKLSAVEERRDLTPEEKQVQDFIKQWGLLTQDQLDKKLQLAQVKQQDEQEFQSWRSASGASDKTAEAVHTLGMKYTKLSYPEIYDQFFKEIATPRKIVKRKVLGVKGKSTGNKTGGSAYTREKIAELAKKPAEYAKHRSKIMEAFRKGEVK